MVNKTKGKRKRDDGMESSSDQDKTPKKTRTAPTNTSLLPPCKVCQEPAAGFHYGANTCEACKGFFRRTLVRGGEYDCINGDGKCDVVQQASGEEKKRICPHCRHMKCLAVGMSTEAIKTGRYTHAKRTQDVIEYRQAKLVNNSNNNNNNCSTSPFSSFSPSNTTVDSTYATDRSSLPSPGSVGRKSDLSDYSLLSPPQFQPAAPKASSATTESHFSDLSAGNALLELSASIPRFDSSSVTSPVTASQCAAGDAGSYATLSPDQLMYGSQEDSCTETHSDESPGFFTSPMSTSSFMENLVDSMVEPGGRLDEVRSVAPFSPLDCSQSQANTPQASPTPPVNFPGQKIHQDSLSDRECQEIVQHILQSYDRLVLSSKYYMTREEMLRNQKECYEKCKARTEAFGPMGQLSTKEYLEVYEQTGLDVDDRQAFLNLLSKMLDQNIREYISFVKTIPGFATLTLNNQKRLIKDHRCEVGLISQTQGFNSELKVQVLPSGRCFCEHDMCKLSTVELATARFKCLTTVQRLNLTRAQRVLLMCVVIFTVGHHDVEEADKVSEIQWKMMQCLRWQLKVDGYANPDPKLSAIISAFLEIKSYSSVFYEWLNSQPFQHYTQFKNNELLADWCSNT